MGKKGLLKKRYLEKKKDIRSRLAQFKRILHEPLVWSYQNDQMSLVPSDSTPHQRAFEELCFCILAANTSAEMGMRTIDSIRHLIHDAPAERITQEIIGKYRFINLRPQYIEHCREYLSTLDEEIDTIIHSIEDPIILREFFADNTGIKGVRYKEASHFLRNLGFSGYAILDKHIINTMHECGILSSNKAPTSKQSYLSMEKRYLEFSDELKIDPDELDLLLWSEKSGKILK